MRNGLRNIIQYFSKSSLRTITLLFMALMTGLYFNAILNPLSPTISQRIAEENTPALDTEESNFLTLLNDHRKSLGLSELGVSATLSKAAEWMSEDMVKSKSLSHTDSLGRDPEERLKAFGYNDLSGENLAEVGSTGKKAFDAWLNSSGHKKNMEDPQWKAIGIARAQDGNTWYWTTEFGTVLDTENVAINPTSPTENEEETNCSNATNRDDGCICENDEQCAAGICTARESLSTGRYCGEDPGEDEESDLECKPNDRTDSGEFDNACDEILHCKDETGRKGLCLCEENAQCASNICLPPDEDFEDKRFCKKEDATNPSPTIGASVDAKFTFKIALPGIGVNTKIGLNNTPKRTERSFYIQFLNENDEIVQEEQVNLTYTSGTYQGELSTTIPQGSYEIKIASDNSLFKTIPGVITISPEKTSFTFPIVTLVTGNISQTDKSSNTLDIFDYNALLSCFGKNSCKNMALIDLNDDGIIDSKDFNILLRGFAIQ